MHADTAPKGTGSPDRVAGKVVVVTGAAHGQGAAEARALAAEGATVVATDIVSLGQVASAGIDGSNSSIVYRQLDVTDPTMWAAFAAELKAQYGHVDGLVNNAGLAQLVVYLLSDESRYLSGAEIAVDGGFTAQAGAKTLFDAVRAVERLAGEF